MDTDLTSPAFTQALDGERTAIEAIPSSELETVQLDIPAAVFTALGVAPKVALLRAEAQRRFGDARAAQFDRLETVARAAGAAHALHLALLAGESLEPIAEEVAEVRSILVHDATSLVNRRLLEASRLGELRGPNGYKNLCFDVLQLVAAFRDAWPAIEGKTPVRGEDLDRAEAIANRLATATGERDQAEAGSSPTGELRRRAYTHFVHLYDEVRRTVAYLRHHEGDADAIAPSLWAGRRRRAKDGSVAPPASPLASANGSSTPIPVGMPGAPAFQT